MTSEHDFVDAASPPASDTLTQWREHQSPHFVLRFPANSPAERDASRLAVRLEAIREALATALDLDGLPGQPIRVVLGETLGDLPDAPTRPADLAIVEDGRIRVAYSSEAPGKGLERALVELALRSSAGLRVDRGGAALIDGVLGHVTQLVDKLMTPADDTVRQLSRRRARMSVVDALRLPSRQPPPAYYAVVTSFVGFLLAAHGTTRFKVFARELDATAPDGASESAYGLPLAVLEQAWLRSLRAGQSRGIPGISVFLRRSAVYLRPYWKEESFILAATLLMAGFSILQPLLFQRIIDGAITPRDFRALGFLVTILALLFAVQSVAALGREYLNARVAAKVLSDIRLQLFGHLQRLSMGFYTQAQVGDIMSRLSGDLFVIQGAMTGVIVQLVHLTLTLLASALVLLWLEWRLGLLALAVSPLVFLAQRLFGARGVEAAYQQQQDSAAVESVLQENLGAQAVVKAFGLEDAAIARFRGSVATLADSTVRATFIGALFGMTAELTVGFIQLMTFGVGAFLAMQGHLSLGALVAFTSLLGNVLGPMQGLSGLVQSLQEATGGMRRVDELRAEEPQIVDAQDAKPLPRLSREIRLADATFTYTGEQANLIGLDLAIRAGESVAFVGPSGCGKTTVLNLLLRFYDPAAGVVSVDGHDLRHITQASLRSQIGTVLQDTFLFNTSIRENIRLGRPGASNADVEAAAKAAEIQEMIMSLPQGYDTVAGERGARLSGGQRQRLAIARAILRDAPILLLDEATSALDPQTEAAISETLRRVAKGRTTITVTHRLSSITGVDRIFVLERGRLVQQGTHNDLVIADGLYRRLWQQQGPLAGAATGLGLDAARLASVPFFSALDGVLLAALASRLVTERYAEGELVFREGDPGDKLYVVARGQLEVVTTGPTGAERRLAMLRPGDYFGEMALLRDAPRSATIRAREAATLLSLDRVQLSALLHGLPGLRTAFEQVVEARLRAGRAAFEA